MKNPQLSRKEEIEKEIKQVEKYCPSEVTSGHWNRLDILKARLDERIRAEQDFLRLIDELILMYKKNKLVKPNNFSIEDRATAMVTLEDLKIELKSTIQKEKTE